MQLAPSCDVVVVTNGIMNQKAQIYPANINRNNKQYLSTKQREGWEGKFSNKLSALSVALWYFILIDTLHKFSHAHYRYNRTIEKVTYELCSFVT